MLARRARARAVAPGSLLPAPGWQLTLCPPPRRTRPGEVAPRPRLTRPLALSPCPHPQRPASLLRRRRLTPSERSPPNVTNEPSKRSSGGLATGAAHPPPPPRATDGVGGQITQLENHHNTLLLFTDTYHSDSVRCLWGQLPTLGEGEGWPEAATVRPGPEKWLRRRKLIIIMIM